MDLNLWLHSAIFHKEWAHSVFYGSSFGFLQWITASSGNPEWMFFHLPLITSMSCSMWHSSHQFLLLSGKVSSIYFSFSPFYVTFRVVILYFNITFYQYNCCSHSEGVVLWQQCISCSLANE